ncbi:hypothetical protein [Caulobacter sp. CCG-8]|uniref:hypothetical protein n=1 Tax=Caulobacter sp. CCG-8 TaxID=3127958 RepID=UPI00307EB7CC
MLAQLARLPLERLTGTFAAFYFAFMLMALWRAHVVGIDNIKGGYRHDAKASGPEMVRGHLRMILFGRTKDGLLRALFWLTRSAFVLFLLVMLVTSAIIQSPYRMSLR